MPHIQTNPDLPAPYALLSLRPEIAEAMTNLMMALRRMDSPLSMGERELIGALVSANNGTTFCRPATGAIAAHLLGGDQARVDAVQAGGPAAEADPKLRSLLAIGAALGKDPKGVTPELVAAAKAAGAEDMAIYDTVLYAAALSMFNRFFDGLDAGGMPSAADYEAMGADIAGKLKPAAV